MRRLVRRYWLLVTVVALVGVAGTMMFSPSSPVDAQTDAAAPAATTTTADEPRPAKPFAVRDGIPNAAAKLRSGRGEVAVAFLGGPITASGGNRGFAPLVARWLGTQFPGTRVRLVNAGLVDGGSPLGAARYDRDVAAHKPDLLFIEFAVDDGEALAGGTKPEDRLRTLERIVHKAWTADPNLDVVMLYTFDETQRDDYRAGRLPPAASVHERVAEHYGIPSIAPAVDMLARFDAGDGKVKWIDWFADASKPTPNGHAAYTDAIGAALTAMLADETAKTPKPHVLKPPLTPGLTTRPATHPAEPMQPPAPLVDADGKTARLTYAMPLVGKHWVESPEFKDEQGRVLWRALTQSASHNGRRLNAGFGLDRSRWGPPMRWLSEFQYFTGPAGVYLFHGTTAGANNITARENDLPIVTFTAPQAGRYVIRVRSPVATMWGLHASMALNVVHFPAGQTKGTSIAFHRTQARIAEPPNLEVDVRLGAGDEVAFQVDTNAVGGGGGAVFRDTMITIGWFGE